MSIQVLLQELMQVLVLGVWLEGGKGRGVEKLISKKRLSLTFFVEGVAPLVVFVRRGGGTLRVWTLMRRL